MNIIDRFMDRKAVVTGNNSGHNYGPPGSEFIIKKVLGAGTAKFQGLRMDGIMGSEIYAVDFDIDPKQFLSGQKDSKLEVSSKWNEVPDEYKNLCVIEIKDDGSIYLSASLRSELKLAAGDGVVYAIERSKKGKTKMYIAKDVKEGTPIDENGILNSTIDWRSLMRHFKQNLLFVDFTPIYSEDVPDLTFYEIGLKPYEVFDFTGTITKMKFNPALPSYMEKQKDTPVDYKSSPKPKKMNRSEPEMYIPSESYTESNPYEKTETLKI